jgi:hypothetical protein
MGALILAGVVQVALDAQDVLGRLWPPAFSTQELGVVLQYWSVLISNFRIARNGRELLATTNNETLRLTSNGQRTIGLRGNSVCRLSFRILFRDHCGGMLFICQRALFSGSELYLGKAIGLQ